MAKTTTKKPVATKGGTKGSGKPAAKPVASKGTCGSTKNNCSK